MGMNYYNQITINPNLFIFNRCREPLVEILKTSLWPQIDQNVQEFTLAIIHSSSLLIIIEDDEDELDGEWDDWSSLDSIYHGF